jgi:mRNA-degrading endonuclease YafQ of YafQ-DinJ toxin-antitoxin module
MRNLAVLCVECHSTVSGNQGFGKNYSKKEIILYKKNWEEQCEDWRQNFGNADDDMEEDEDLETDDSEEVVEDQEDEPIHTLYKDWIVKGEYHYSFEYNLEKGNVIVYSVSSDEQIDFLIMKRSEYKRAAEEGDTLMKDEDTFEANDSFFIPRNGWYTIVVSNAYDDDARVPLDLSIWP